ncbi:MAG: hypothetical protein Q8K93_32295 [Reyranella sp.]|uniref:hypothetical protein n=1 Tax=Reyranella sp. TaxID=1929291 RepID=UPI00272FC026|nr:hypothetical protein [Reyranella sp.]MDP1966874.1 hypothetical protein [Reyranella sp.]MDP2374607.1 hypothetical protein [Reyranella sp.]
MTLPEDEGSKPERWATDVQKATRALVLAYAQAWQSVEGLSARAQVVHPGGLWAGRPLLVVRLLLRESLVEHITTVLRATSVVRLRAFAAARQKVKRSEIAQPATSPLEQAEGDIRGLLELAEGGERSGQRALKTILSTIRRLLPFIWTGAVLAQFDRWSNAPQNQLVAFAFVVLAGYHVLAWLTLPFHDAAERKYLLLEGYVGKPSDGLTPLAPPASRYEAALFKLIGRQPPIVMSWETVVPLLHYAIASALIVFLVIKLPFAMETRIASGVIGSILIGIYIKRIKDWWSLLRVRYKGRSRGAILLSLLPSLAVVGAIKGDDDDNKA